MLPGARFYGHLFFITTLLYIIFGLEFLWHALNKVPVSAGAFLFVHYHNCPIFGMRNFVILKAIEGSPFSRGFSLYTPDFSDGNTAAAIP